MCESNQEIVPLRFVRACVRAHNLVAEWNSNLKDIVCISLFLLAQPSYQFSFVSDVYKMYKIYKMYKVCEVYKVLLPPTPQTVYLTLVGLIGYVESPLRGFRIFM